MHEPPVAPFGRDVIESILPHREPFLLLDEVTELEPGAGSLRDATCARTTGGSPGTFPAGPVMPGVLIVEAMAQAGAVAVLVEEENRGKIAFFAGIDDCRFKRIVEPGDTLTLTCEIDTVRGPIGRGKATAHVGDAARGARDPDLRGGAVAMLGAANGTRIGITGLGVHVPERVLTNDELCAVRRHDRRVDRRADGHPGAPHRRRRRGAHRHRAAGRPAARSRTRASTRRTSTSSSARP